MKILEAIKLFLFPGKKKVVTRRDILERAIKHVKKGIPCCAAFNRAFIYYGINLKTYTVFPEHGKKQLVKDCGGDTWNTYWWSLGKIYPRLKYMHYFWEKYKNDTTNVRELKDHD